MIERRHGYQSAHIRDASFRQAAFQFILSFSLCHRHTHTSAHGHIHTLTQRRGVVYLMDILLLLNKFLMSCCGLTGALHSNPHAQTLFRCGLAKCAFSPKFSNCNEVSLSRPARTCARILHSWLKTAAKIEGRCIRPAEPRWLPLNLAVLSQPRTSAALTSDVLEMKLARSYFEREQSG